MATRIYENSKTINAIGKNYVYSLDEIHSIGAAIRMGIPIIAKGNVYQGIIAQW